MTVLAFWPQDLYLLFEYFICRCTYNSFLLSIPVTQVKYRIESQRPVIFINQRLAILILQGINLTMRLIKG